MSDTVNYRATSSFSNPMQILNSIALILGTLSLPEVVGVLPATWLPYIIAVTAAVNLILRQYTEVRPVAFIKPGESQVVQVAKLD